MSNLLHNPGFEDGDISGWANNGDVSSFTADAGGYEGAYSGKVVTGTGAPAVYTDPAYYPPAAPFFDYGFNVWITAASGLVIVKIQFLDASKSVLLTQELWSGFATGTWTQHGGSCTAPENTAYVAAYIQFGGSSTIYIDSANIEVELFSGPKSAGLGSWDSGELGTDWTDYDQIYLSDNSYAETLDIFSPSGATDNEVKLMVGGSITGSNKATGTTIPTSDTYESFPASGYETDLWGLSLTPAIVNDPTFGCSYKIAWTGLSDVSDHLKATQFGFAIPAHAAIKGVKVEVERKVTIGGGLGYVYVDHIRMTVYYTISHIQGIQSVTGLQSITL